LVIFGFLFAVVVKCTLHKTGIRPVIDLLLVDFPWSREVEQHLKDSFQLSKFRALQLRAINLTLAGRDLFLVMPTGRGKSLCYQLPAVYSKGTVRRTKPCSPNAEYCHISSTIDRH